MKDSYHTEDHSRSVLRSIIWRVMGIAALALITYLVTQSVAVTTVLTVVYHSLCILGYYLHERFWLKIDQYWETKWRTILRLVLYELIFGVVVLGVLSWLITGQVKQASIITIIYIGNKLWMYVVYDMIWNRISWKKTLKEANK